MSYRNFGALAVYKKAVELREISRAIASYVSFNKEFIQLYSSNSLRDNIADLLITDAVSIPEKIAFATRSTSYSERKSSARLISIMLRNINSYCLGLEKDGVKEKEYLNLLRAEIRSFRELFKLWRNSLAQD